MNTVTNREREQDLSMASNLVRGIQPRVPTFLVQRNDDEAFEGCRGSEKDVFFGLNKYSRNVHYSRSLKNPALQLLQKSAQSASTTPQRPIWHSFGTVGVRDF